ncbi:MAG: four helix bundle protein [Planctomycetes bacterium]|nr:four helix bundle protein [Planctomycetota bacterium]
MDSEELKQRTKVFAVDVIRAVEKFPRNRSGDIIARQIIRSATSIGANYRAACRAQSKAHFISKLSIVEEEADETLYWLELAVESNIAGSDKISNILKEADELTAIFSASRRTARINLK